MNTKQNKNRYPFLRGGGEMGEIIRSKNWENTPMGAPENWPVALKFAISTMLHTAFPNFIFWGKEFYCFYNDAYRPSLGMEGKHPNILGQAGSEAWAEIWDTIHPLLESVWKTGKPTWSENKLIPFYRNGKVEDIYWTFSYSALLGNDGSIQGILTTCTETTDSVNNLKQLEESKDELEFAIEAADLGTWDYDPISDKLKTNDRLKSWFGLPLDNEIELSQATEAILHTDRDRVNKLIVKAFDPKNGGKYDATYTIRNKINGQERVVRAVGRAWFDDKLTAYRFNGILQDISDQHRSLIESKQNEERFRHLVNNVDVGIAIMNVDNFVVQLANDTALNIWGRSIDDVLGNPFFEVVPEIEGGLRPVFDSVVNSKKTQFGLEYPFVLNRHGKTAKGYFNFSFRPGFDERGEVKEIICVAFEVTEMIKARFELEESEKQLKQFVRQSPIAMGILKGEDLKIEMANEALINVFWRKKRRQAIGKSLLQLFPNLKDSKYPEILRGVMETGVPFSEKESYAKLEDETGSWEFYVDYDYVPLKELDGSISGILLTTTEVTDKVLARKKLENFSKELEKKVRERTELLKKANEKLQDSVRELKKSNDELESFAYVSSHDLQEPLRKIQMFAGRILEHEEQNFSEKGKHYFDRITNAAERMRTLIDDLLAFSRAAKSDEQAFQNRNLNELLDEVIVNLSDKIEESKTKITSGKLCTVNVISFQIKQIFQNLIENSIKFAKSDVPAQITINSKKVAGTGLEHLGLDGNKEYCEMTFQDNGIGFDPVHSEKIFTVFQRLHGKMEYKGTGIGLAIVKKIALNHQGEIFAMAKEGDGATFTLYLPT